MADTVPLFGSDHIIRIGLVSNIPGLVEKNAQFALGEEEIAAENRQQLLDILIRMLTDTEMEVHREVVLGNCQVCGCGL